MWPFFFIRIGSSIRTRLLALMHHPLHYQCSHQLHQGHCKRTASDSALIAESSLQPATSYKIPTLEPSIPVSLLLGCHSAVSQPCALNLSWRIRLKMRLTTSCAANKRRSPFFHILHVGLSITTHIHVNITVARMHRTGPRVVSFARR